MRICGIISEYNPFHLGHEEHIRKAREKTGADIIICAMSGNFTQRGEPAIFDKWIRTRCALLCGADAVIELPLLTAVQSAEGFASGGVSVIDAAGADFLCFGSETDDKELLESIAAGLSEETAGFKKLLKESLGSGDSFPKARMKAAFPDAPEAACPNAILGIEYIKAIKRSGSSLKPFAVKRVGGAYHSEDMDSPFPSATAIRKAFREGKSSGAFGAMPAGCAQTIERALSEGLRPVFPGVFDRELLYAIRRGGPGYLRTLHDVSEGLENRIYKAAETANGRDELIKAVKTKRYAYTRISRVLLYALLGITKEMVAEHNARGTAFLRVLGVRGERVLSILSRVSKAPLICGSAASSGYPGTDIAASDIYALSQDSPPFRNLKRDLTEKLIVV